MDRSEDHSGKSQCLDLVALDIFRRQVIDSIIAPQQSPKGGWRHFGNAQKSDLLRRAC
jgi:hypothetical protein